MRSHSRLVLLTLLTVITLGVGANGVTQPHPTPRFRLVDLGTLGGSQSWGYAINDRGDVTGGSTLPNASGFHAFLYSNGLMADLGTLGGENSQADAINNAGQAVGLSNVPGQPLSVTHAFLYSDGAMTDLGTLGGSYSAAHGINNRGQITGISQTASGQYLAILYEDGVMTDLGTLGGSFSYGWRLNNRGDVIGRSATQAGTVHAFFYRAGEMIDLGDGQAYDVNDHGQVVGTGDMGGFLYVDGSVVNLTPLGVYSAYGINNVGQIVGAGPKNGLWQGVLLSRAGLTYLNDALDATGAGWHIVQANGINERGQIVAIGNYGGFEHAVRLDPVHWRQGVQAYQDGFALSLDQR